MLRIKQSESTAARRRVPVALVSDSDGKTPQTGITLSAGDMKVSKNGAAEANHSGALTELAGGDYYYEFAAGEVDTVGYLTGRIVKSGVRTYRIACQVVAFDPYDAAGLGLSSVSAIKTKTDQLAFTVANRVDATINQTFPTNFASLSIDASGRVDLGKWIGVAPNALIAGRVDADVGAMQSAAAATVWVSAARTLTAAGLDAITVETGLNARQALSIIASSCAGTLAGAATATVTIAAAGQPATNRITAAVTSEGNRTTVTLSPPA